VRNLAPPPAAAAAFAAAAFAFAAASLPRSLGPPRHRRPVAGPPRLGPRESRTAVVHQYTPLMRWRFLWPPKDQSHPSISPGLYNECSLPIILGATRPSVLNPV